MAQIETWLDCDLDKLVEVKKLPGNLFTSDNSANKIGLRVNKGGQDVTLSGGCTGYVIRQDGYTVSLTGTVSGNTAYIVLTTSCYVVPGQISIVIKNDTTTIGACCGVVTRTTTDAIVDPGHVIPSLEELLAQIAACEAATTAATTAATNANTKAGLADTAATNANTKAGLADTAATNANTKAGLANDAATLANTKAGLADTAATLANTKAGLADTAATNANTKAALADEKATLANTKAGLADAAATSANSAASSATTAAASANTAAGKIDNMTVDAEGASSSASADATISEVSGHKHIHFTIPKGADGRDGVIAQVDAGLFSMNINSDGDLICTYSTSAPALAIDANGDLIYTI